MLIQDTAKSLNDLFDTAEALNGLIQTSTDRGKGFAEAARAATKAELAVLFQGQSAGCAAGVAELQWLVTSIGARPKSSGTLAGAVRRFWMKAKGIIGDGDMAWLEEMKRIEERAAAAYTKALTAGLPPQIRSALQLQHYAAVRNQNLIRDLYDCHKAPNDTVLS